ncbi:MAG: tetratricopeptide repeat protein [Spirochaetales bacterium]|nr:tetratricopeptide repeat protein [Spirochaetales bacterium]
MLFFRKKEKRDPYEIMSEKWKTSFSLFDRKRFDRENTVTYESGAAKGKYFLLLKKKDHFAWILDEQHRYNNFYLEADVAFDEGNGHSALGFVFRYVNEENFYYFLISKRGFFRFDVLFNRNPLVRIDWTESPLIKPGENSLRIIAQDTHFSFYIDDEWVAELEDDTLSAGSIGFAAQNYNEKKEARFYMKRFLIDSRPIEVDRHFERWVHHIPQEPQYRIELAKTFFAMEAFPAAAVQLKKALKHKKPIADDYFLFAELMINTGMYDLALENIERCLDLDPDYIRAVREKANILYLKNRFLEARDYLQSNLERGGDAGPVFKDNAPAWNLLGNCEYALGNWDKAFEAYDRACRIQPDMPLFFLNAARALEMQGDKDRSLEYYSTSAGLFFRQEAYGELYPIFSRIKKFDPQNSDVKILEGKILFHEEKFEEAEKIFQPLIEKGIPDSSIYFLSGIIASNRGDREKAVSLLQKACELENSFYLHWLKLAENKAILGLDPEQELKKAYELDPEEPWTLNQYGLFYMDKGDYEKAKEYFYSAYGKSPSSTAIVINLSEVLSRSNEMKEAFQVLNTEALKDVPEIINHRGNLCIKLGDTSSAIREYEKALKLEPDNPVFLENCAKACIERDMIKRAEEMLVKLYDISPTPAVCNLIGYCALIQRDWPRAEVAFRDGLEKDPENIEILTNLASLYLDRMDCGKAKEAVMKVLEKDPEHEEGKKILFRIREKSEVHIACVTCGREWWAPENVSVQSRLTIHGEPPPDAPAGKCATCGKVYCVACAQHHVRESRFFCPDCDVFLKLSDDWLKYLLLEKLREEETREGDKRGT